MKQEDRKLPIGIQSFEKIRENGYLYVDKTEDIYHLVHTNVFCSLSRPRRFGKSVLLSTMRAYWEGKKELFSGLKIEELERDNPRAWQAYPVFYLDFSRGNYNSNEALERILKDDLAAWENQYAVNPVGKQTLAVRFRRVIAEAARQTGRKCVIEYDKPLREVTENRELFEDNWRIMNGFFSTLKSLDANLQFVFMTGVTKFSKGDIFELNQLRDISISREAAEICGITEQEMREYFIPEIKALAEEQLLTIEECLSKLKREYAGYCFQQRGMGVYNPSSLLSALAERAFGAYWLETGMPDFLVNRLREIHFDPRQLTGKTLYATRQMLRNYRDDNPDLIPLLYQTGILTLADCNAQRNVYTLGFPNHEVRHGFLEVLMPA